MDNSVYFFAKSAVYRSIFFRKQYTYFAMLAVGVMLGIIPFGFYGKMALEWFIIGAVIVKMQIHITSLDKIPMPIVSIAYCLGAVAVLLLDINVLKNIFIFMGIVFWVRISKEIYYNKKLRRRLLWMSEWTFIIYVSHELTLSSVQKICLRLFPKSPVFLFGEYVLIPVFVITGCMTAGIVFKKAVPAMYRLNSTVFPRLMNGRISIRWVSRWSSFWESRRKSRGIKESSENALI